MAFSTLNSFWFVFGNFFFFFLQNVPTISSLWKSLKAYVHRAVFLTFQSQKNFFRPILILNLNLGFLSLFYFIKSIYVIYFTSTSFILILIWYLLLYLLTTSSNLPIFTFFILKSYIYKFYSFKVLINLSAATNVLLLCVEKISTAFFLVIISLTYYKIHYLYVPVFYLVCE